MDKADKIILIDTFQKILKDIEVNGIYSLCLKVRILQRNEKISEYASRLMIRYIADNRPEGFIDGYYWAMEEKQPRIDFCNEHIKLLSD